MPETACGTVAEGGSSIRQINSRKKGDGSCRQLTLDLQQAASSGDPAALEHALERTEEQCRWLEKQLSGAKAAARAADQAKTDFLNLMNHEVRTPMNGIISLVELLNSLPKTGQQQEYFNGILVSCDSLLHLINNMIDYSQLCSGELALESQLFSPRAILDEATGPLLNILATKGLQYHQDLDDAIPATLRGDPRRVKQIIENLLSNAIKFSEQGTIRLSLQLSGQTETHAILHFTIADNGIGIHPTLRDKIFAPFVQADSSSTRKCGGAGLGLTIARQLAELMGGSIRLETGAGNGSIFHFDVPLQMDIAQETERSAEKDQQSLLQWGGRSLHILLAEDHETNRNLTEKILKRLGHTVSAAHNGRKAVEISEKERFDLILMDMEMPEMDGWEATSIIRRREAAGNRRVPIIAVTAHAIKGNREILLTSGFDGYLSKPIDFVALTREMKRLASTVY